MDDNVTLMTINEKSPTYIDLLEMKQIDEQCNELGNILRMKHDIDIKDHAKAMLKLSKQLLSILTKRSLYEDWIHLSKIQLQDQEYSWKEMTWRRNDNYIDIDEFYKKGRNATWEYVQDFKNTKTQKTTLNYKQVVKQFSLFIKNVTGMMVDLNERLSVLMLQIDPNSKSKLFLKTSTITKTNIIVNRCKEITALFESTVAGQSEYDEILRLNRRMAVVLKEAEFIEFSDSHEKKCTAIKTFLKKNAELESDDETKYALVNIICRINSLESDIEKHCSVFLEECINNDKKFQNEVTVNYCSIENKNMVRDLTKYFIKIAERFVAFNDEFEEIKGLLDNALEEQ